MSAPTPGPFSPTGRVRKQMLPITLDQALEGATAAGFRQTTRSKPHAAHVQRAWNTAATIRPVPGGVVIQPAWTTAQIVAVVSVLTMFVLLAICPTWGALIAA